MRQRQRLLLNEVSSSSSSQSNSPLQICLDFFTPPLTRGKPGSVGPTDSHGVTWCGVPRMLFNLRQSQANRPWLQRKTAYVWFISLWGGAVVWYPQFTPSASSCRCRSRKCARMIGCLGLWGTPERWIGIDWWTNGENQCVNTRF